MSKDKITVADDLFIFAEEPMTPSPLQKIKKSPWKVLIVDDEESIHQVTHLLLDHFEYQDAKLDMYSAYSSEEAKKILTEHHDIAVILLDVVMGAEDSGLQLVRFIRNELKNRLARIVLRTGQPGQAPEKTVIVDYDINDYKLKTELTADKIYVTMVAALRSYHDLLRLEQHKKTLERTIDATTRLFSNRKIPELIQSVNQEFQSVLMDDYCFHETSISAMTINIIEDEYLVYSTMGEFKGREGQLITDFLDSTTLELIKKAHQEEKKQFSSTCFVGYLKDDKNSGTLFFIQLSRELDDWDYNIIEIFCATVKSAYTNLLLSNDVESTQRELIYALGEVAEARSQETGYHVKRVSEYARLFGELLHLDQVEIDLLSLASPVHDIGKLTIPDAILNKPSALTTDEFEIIKTHTSAGNAILKGSNRMILKTAALIAMQHHEKWNGSGYPQGLSGEDIHLFGRIVALCDVFDALSSDRVYKEAWPMQQILAYIKEQRGIQFDPKLVDIFLEHADRFIAIKKKLN